MNKLFPDEKIFETNFFTVHQDWECPIPAFFIVAPKRTIRTIDEFTNEEASEYIFLIRALRKGMKEVLNISNVYFFQNEDTKHNFHLWVFPRYEWMNTFGRKIESVKPIMNYAAQNMLGEEHIAEVKNAATKMKEYFDGVKNISPR